MILTSAALAFGLCSAIASASASSHDTSNIDLVTRQTALKPGANSSAASYIYRNGPDAGNFTFTITINPENDDMWFRMSAPAAYSYIAVGAGTTMKSSKAMFLGYQGKKDGALTISARGPCDHCEPANIKDFGLNSAQASDDKTPYGIRGSTYFVNAFIANGTRRAGIDPTSVDQPFIFAVGPLAHSPRSDEPDAPLRMHAFHGNFKMDMTQAYGNSLPPLGTSSRAVVSQGFARTDKERASPLHAALMVFSFLIVFPLGIVLLKAFQNVNMHMYVQAFGLLFVTIGWILGFIVSKRYIRSKDYKSGHQILGIFIYLLLLLQFTTGLLHHIKFKRTSRPSFLIKPHKYGLGALVLSLGIVNAAIGFRFAVAPAWNLIYIPLVIAVFVLLAIGAGAKAFMDRRRAKSATVFGGPAPPAQPYPPPAGPAPPYAAQAGMPSGHGPVAGAYSAGIGPIVTTTGMGRSEIELGKMGPPPTYDGVPAKPTQFV